MDTPDYTHWWKHSPAFKLVAGKTEPLAGLEFWFALVWQPIEPVAWAYELVRRLPNTNARLPEEVRAAIRTLPNWNVLTIEQQDCLAFSFPEERRQRPGYHVNKQMGYESIVPGYSIPRPISFDVSRMSDKEILEAVKGGAASKRPRLSGYNQNQKRCPDWWLVEELETPQLGKKKREDAFEEAHFFVPSILSGWLLARNPTKEWNVAFEFPYVEGLSGECFDLEQIRQVIASTLKAR